MFDYSLLHWTTFFAAALLLNITPGPGIVLVADRLAGALRGNPRIGLWLEHLMGGVLVALGLKLAASER